MCREAVSVIQTIGTALPLTVIVSAALGFQTKHRSVARRRRRCSGALISRAKSLEINTPNVAASGRRTRPQIRRLCQIMCSAVSSPRLDPTLPPRTSDTSQPYAEHRARWERQ